MKSKLLLLDANVVIEAHRLAYWKALYTQFEISLPSVVIQQEVKFFQSQNIVGSTQTVISLQPQVESGEICEIAATLDEMDLLASKLKPSFYEILGDGELEALALIVADKVRDMRFSTADGPTIKTLGALCLANYGVSFEELLREIGQSARVAGLRKHYHRKFFDYHLAQGRQESGFICV